MTGSYNRNAGLALNADLTLMLRRGAHNLASVLERGAAQACVWVETRSWLRSVFDKGCEVRIWRPPRLRKDARSVSSDLRVWQRTRSPRLRLERDLRVWKVRVWGFVFSNFFIAYICILVELWIRIAQPRIHSTAGSKRWLTSRIVHIIFVIDYLAVDLVQRQVIESWFRGCMEPT